METKFRGSLEAFDRLSIEELENLDRIDILKLTEFPEKNIRDS